MLDDPHLDSPHGGHPKADRNAPFGHAAARGRRRRQHMASAAGVILAVAAIGIWGFGLHKTAPEKGAPTAPPPAVTVALPLQESVTAQTELTGQFSAVNQVVLLAQVSGYLTEIHFQDGQIVRKGDLLFVIDPRPYVVQLHQANAQYQMAIAALELADKEVERAEQLSRVGAIAVESLDERTRTQKTAVAAVKVAEAAIHAAQLNLEFTHIVAPFSGRVSMRRVSIGSLVSGGSGSSTPTALTSIVSLDPIYLDYDMSEADYSAYQHSIAARPAEAKTTVQVSLDGERSWSRSGEMDFLDNQIDRGSGTLHARATLANPDMVIAPGQFARVRVPVSPAQTELLVPDAAIVTDQSTKAVMVVQEDGLAVPKQVEVGVLDDRGMRAILHGLKPTDQVVIKGLMRLRPGLKVAAHLEPPADKTKN